MEIEDRVGLDAEARRSIEALIGAQRTLEDVVRWGLRREPPILIADVITQDEFTQDVVVPLPDSTAFLVYDTT